MSWPWEVSRYERRARQLRERYGDHPLFESLDDLVSTLMAVLGPDGHVDGHDSITAFLIALNEEAKGEVIQRCQDLRHLLKQLPEEKHFTVERLASEDSQVRQVLPHVRFQGSAQKTVVTAL